MQSKRRRWWPLLKGVLSVIILVLIARRFASDLAQPELYREPISLRWLLPAGLLYLLGLAMACSYWGWLLSCLGPRPEPISLARAYYLGQLGKYVPGKAIALVMRAAFARGAGVTPGLAGLTAFYEVLTTMASGVLLAAAIFFAQSLTLAHLTDSSAWSDAWFALIRLEPPVQGFSPPILTAIALILLLGCGWPLLPPIFNRLSDRLSLPFRSPGIEVPRLRFSHLLAGLGFGAIGWGCMGLALACTLGAVEQAALPWTPAHLAQLTAVLAVAYVAGFLVLIAPGGLGVRELFLTWLLTPEIAAAHDLSPELARGKVVLVVLLLRLAWTLAEVLLAFGLYWKRDKS